MRVVWLVEHQIHAHSYRHELEIYHFALKVADGMLEYSHGIVNRIQGKYMLENKKLSDREILYQFLRRIPIQNRTIAYDIVNRDLNENRVLKVPNNNVM